MKATPYKETVTDHQATLLRAFLGCEYITDPEKYEPNLIGYQTWTFSVCYDIPEASRGGVIAKAIKAGLIVDMSDEDGEQVALSTLGYNTLLHIDNIDISTHTVSVALLDGKGTEQEMTIAEATKFHQERIAACPFASERMKGI